MNVRLAALPHSLVALACFLPVISWSINGHVDRRAVYLTAAGFLWFVLQIRSHGAAAWRMRERGGMVPLLMLGASIRGRGPAGRLAAHLRMRGYSEPQREAERLLDLEDVRVALLTATPSTFGRRLVGIMLGIAVAMAVPTFGTRNPGLIIAIAVAGLWVVQWLAVSDSIERWMQRFEKVDKLIALGGEPQK